MTRYLLFVIAILASCSRSPIKSSDEALRIAPRRPDFRNDLIDDRFGEDLKKHIEFWQTRKDLSSRTMKFGPESISGADYLAALKNLHDYFVANADPGLRMAYLRDNFVPMEVYGRDDWAEIFMTSYFSPVLEGRTKAEGAFTEPLYGRPADLVEVDLKSYTQNSTLAQFQNGTVKTLLPDILRGRLLAENAQSSIPRIVPYYTRAEIQGGALSKKKLELYYVDPVDSFILHIQGSGTLRIPGEPDIYMVYDGQNGHRYEAVGSFLKDVIPLEQMSLYRIEAHLRSLTPAQRDAILRQNPSYIFFKKSKQAATTSFGITAQAERTVATDTRYFPKGALALLEFKNPRFANDAANEPEGFDDRQRLVFDHDTGGAIKGSGRLDFYWGEGAQARRAAGVIKDKGRLYYLFPKSSRKE